MEMAIAAGAITLRYFGTSLTVDSKSDGTPVTIADREAESFLRGEIGRRFPGHGILGEEFGEEPGTESVRWILDPIDGTKSFMRGVPLYAVLIGVEVEGEPLVGVAHFPALHETVAAARGLGCLWSRPDGTTVPARVSETDEISRSVLLTTDTLRAAESPVSEGWGELTSRTAFVRSWGDAYGHALVATGRAEIMVDPLLSPWDAAPLLPILLEAGGRFTDLAGNDTIHGGSGVSTNGRLHSEVVRILR
jgi:histidinol phosphatase-like enzyme (inositol monophosphatase family)